MTTTESTKSNCLENEKGGKLSYYELHKERIKEYRKMYRQLESTKKLKKEQNARYYQNKKNKNVNENDILNENKNNKTT